MPEKDCEFCNEEFEDTVDKKYESWTVQLFLNQYYPGRCLIKLNRHIVDFFKLEEAERAELFEKVMPELKQVLNDIFDPDLYNYASLGNDCRHLHIHVIPRYSSEIVFRGVRFEDENWNSHYTPYPTDFEVSDKIFGEMKSEISTKLNENY